MLKSHRIIRVDSGKGVSLAIDTRSLKPGPKLQGALDHLLGGGALKELSATDRGALARKRSLIGSGENALIVRFDLKVVRIDEKVPIDVGRFAKPRRRKK